jgi:hypothetical protein
MDKAGSAITGRACLIARLADIDDAIVGVVRSLDVYGVGKGKFI